MTEPQGDDAPPVPSDERNTLAWERTAMALAVVAAGIAHHTWSKLGTVALVPLVPIGLLWFWVLAEGWHRYDDDRFSPVYRSIGGPTFLLAAATALGAALEAVHLFV